MVAVQFNWIFILIVGAIILVFFITIVQKQRTVSEENIAQTIQTDLRAIFSGASVSTGTSSIINIPKTEINFDCEGFKVGKQMPFKFPYSFSPSLIKSSRSTISAWSYDWSVPYRVTNFLYVTSPDIRYIIVNDVGNGLAEVLNKTLPPKYIEKGGKKKLFMNKEIIELSDIPSLVDENNYKVKFIFFNLPGAPSGGLDTGRDVSAINIIPTCSGLAEDVLDCYGEVEFYEKSAGWVGAPGPGPQYYVGIASLLGAVFSDNKESYDCSMNNAFGRLKAISEIYEDRTTGLSDYYQTNDPSSPCNTLLNDAKGIIGNIKTAAENSDYSDINSESENLKVENDVIQENSCPAVY